MAFSFMACLLHTTEQKVIKYCIYMVDVINFNHIASSAQLWFPTILIIRTRKKCFKMFTNRRQIREMKQIVIEAHSKDLETEIS